MTKVMHNEIVHFSESSNNFFFITENIAGLCWMKPLYIIMLAKKHVDVNYTHSYIGRFKNHYTFSLKNICVHFESDPQVSPP